MKIIGKFKIIDSFKLTGRGLVAKGSILEGVVRIGSFTTLKINAKAFNLQISGVEFIDTISTREFWIGLMFTYDSESQLKEFENIKLEEQVAEIYENN